MSWIKRTLATDTSTRDIAALAAGMTEGTWTIRRTGKLVYMVLDNAAFAVSSGSTWSMLKLLQVGFRPVAVPAYLSFPSATRGTSVLSGGGLRVSRYGDVDVYDVASKRTIVVASWVTDDAWPTSLPGVSV